MDASKKVGVLEYFGCPDVEFYTGLAYHCIEGFPNAITHLELVEERSQFYSDALIQALQSKAMLDVIANANLEKYRIPGTHTGYLPFSVANESKEYVMRWLPQVENRFK